jgi:hypothetical protein
MLNVTKDEARAERIRPLRALDFDRKGRKDMVSSHFTENMHKKEKHDIADSEYTKFPRSESI